VHLDPPLSLAQLAAVNLISAEAFPPDQGRRSLMLKQFILATAATALVAAPASARHRHHRHYDHDVYSNAVPWMGYGNWDRSYGHAGYQPYNWARGYRYSHHRGGDWDDDDHHHHHRGWYGNDQGEDNDDQGEDEDD